MEEFAKAGIHPSKMNVTLALLAWKSSEFSPQIWTMSLACCLDPHN